MKLHDQHLHSRHSIDSRADPSANCERALAVGLSGLTFTEHYDVHPAEREKCRWDYDAIAATVADLRRRFSPPLTVGLGIEVDYQPHLIDETLAYLDRHEFDLVLLSVHWAGGRALHRRRQWQGLTAATMLDDYLGAMLSAAELCRELAAAGSRPFDIISHFDYVKRYLASYWNSPLDGIVPARLDPILAAFIAADVTPEINTAGLRRSEAAPYPVPAILERYWELGGRHVSIGSDAHRSAHIGAGFTEAVAILQRIGFSGEAVFHRRQRSIIPWKP